MRDSKIEWTHHTFNPWLGCTKLSPACDHCYAEVWAKRTGNAALWHGERRRTTDAYWRQPLKWDAAAASAGERHRVFCASLADVFDNQVSERWRADLWTLIAACPHLDFLLLTKRPQNIAKMLPDPRTGTRPWRDGWPNVWLGTTVENQEEADRRIPHLLSVPARVRFLSCEPLLGRIELSDVTKRSDAVRQLGKKAMAGISWIIAGGESGPSARPMHPDWARSLRDQCAGAGTAFHFKQWGEWTPGENVERTRGIVETAHWYDDRWSIGRENLADEGAHRDDEPDLYRVGKKAAGRVLDGRTHNEFPLRDTP